MVGRLRDNGRRLRWVVGLLLGALTVTSVVAVVGGGATASGGGSVAVADVAPARGGRPFHLVKKVRFADIICVKKRVARDHPGKCKGVAVFKTTAPYRRTGARTARGDQGWCKDWWSEMRGLYYYNWKERAEGTFCWVEGPSAPDIYRNTFRCGYSSGIGYDVRVEDCWKVRRTGDTTYGWWISVYDKFRVSAVAEGLPLHWTYQFHVNLHPSGVMKYYVDD
jgi:hypothetical protein